MGLCHTGPFHLCIIWQITLAPFLGVWWWSHLSITVGGRPPPPPPILRCILLDAICWLIYAFVDFHWYLFIQAFKKKLACSIEFFIYTLKVSKKFKNCTNLIRASGNGRSLRFRRVQIVGHSFNHPCSGKCFEVLSGTCLTSHVSMQA